MVERDPEIDIERNPTRRGMAVERPAAALGPMAAPLAARRDDRVHWGPVWAGFVVSMLAMIILGALAAAIGLAAAVPPNTTDTATAQTGSGVAAAVIVLLSLFLGGYASGYLLEEWGARWGAAHGILVSGLILTMAVLGTALGSVGIGNAMANIFGALNLQRVFDARAYANIAPAEIAATAARAAGWFTVIALLCVGAAALGGYLASRRDSRTVRRDTAA
ncbi:MAG: hypothetical protein H7338_19960 [Candidatus Sericytochromatia bacterium]|nr:hypothetical protein [Candidatus Sericytochromatia bacterium]